MLVRMTGLVDGLVVRPERMRENIERGLGLHASSRVLVALVESGGLSREEAYAIVQRAALRAADERAPLRDLLAVDPAVAQTLSLGRARRLLRRRGVPAPRARGHRPARRARRRSRPRGGRPMPRLTRVPAVRQGPRPVRARRRPAAARRVATGISAFDVVLPTPIPDKGRVLTGLSRFWFARRRRGHRRRTTCSARTRRTCRPDCAARRRPAELRGRMMICRRAHGAPDRGRRPRLPRRLRLEGVPATRRGLRRSRCRPGLRESDRLPEPIFTPATKAELGEHDENIDFDAMVGARSAAPLRRAGPRHRARAVRARAPRSPSAAGILLADTKFEFGLDAATGELLLIDEVLTPDSSRFWDAATYEPGRAQASFDKQFVRDWLEPSRGTRRRPGPELPDDVVAGTRARYIEAFERITGASFERYLAGGRDRPMTQLPVRRQRHAQARHPRPAGPGGGGQPRPPRRSRASAASASAGGSS